MTLSQMRSHVTMYSDFGHVWVRNTVYSIHQITLKRLWCPDIAFNSKSKEYHSIGG